MATGSAPGPSARTDEEGSDRPAEEDRLLRVGVLGFGQIARAAHSESCTKSRNASLHAICDAADDLRDRMAATHAPDMTFSDYDAMLADPEVEAVIIATADALHVPAARRALGAGKHVLCEKPLATAVEEAESLRPSDCPRASAARPRTRSTRRPACAIWPG